MGLGTFKTSTHKVLGPIDRWDRQRQWLSEIVVILVWSCIHISSVTKEPLDSNCCFNRAPIDWEIWLWVSAFIQNRADRKGNPNADFKGLESMGKRMVALNFLLLLSLSSCHLGSHFWPLIPKGRFFKTAFLTDTVKKGERTWYYKLKKHQ